MSTDAFLKSVKKFLDKEVSIMPFNNRSRSPPKAYKSRLPVEIYVLLRCYCCVRILGQLTGYWAT